VKFTDNRYVSDIITNTDGRAQYKHNNGVISTVQIERADLGTRKIRVANLPPEVPQTTLRTAMTPYGTVHTINNEQWSTKYRYVVDNGIRIIQMAINKHIPSHITVAGYKALVSYEGQPQTR
jgi:hypothetical protein